MTYTGYMTLGGTEIINANRTAAYVRNILPQFGLEKIGECEGLHLALGDPEYGTPLSDQPPWYDPDDPDTLGFFGFYPLSIEGIDDSTRQSTVTELSTDGGFIGLRRWGSREIRVTGLLLAVDDASLEAGLSWFRIALVGEGHCATDPTVCGGDTMCYLSVCPDVCEDGVDLDVPVDTVESVGYVRPGNPHTTRFPSDLGPAKASWDLTVDNTVARVQMVDCTNGSLLKETGPLLLQRTNFAYNPSFEQDLSWWESSGGNIFTRQFEPFEGEWMGLVDSNGIAAGRLLSGRTAMAAGPQRMTAWLRGTGTATLRIVEQDGATHTSQAITLNPAALTKHSVSAATGPGLARFAIDTPAGSEYVIDRVLMEDTTEDRPYFDGRSVEAGRTARWLGPADAAPSVTAVTMPLVIEGDDSLWCPRTVSDLGEVTGTVTLTQYQPFTAPDCIEPYLRHLHNVSVTQGPLVTQRYAKNCGAMVQVEFTAVAGTPWRYHEPQVLFAPGQVDAEPTPNPAANIVCTPTTPGRLADPDCVAVPAAPRPPVITDPCLTTPLSYTRGYFEIPPETIPEWKWAIPTVYLQTKTAAVKHLRVRFYPTPFGFKLQDLGPCDYCGEFIVSYIPPNATMTIDGMTRTASTVVAGGKQYTATHLVYGTAGAPMIWPELTCGVQYWMTVDVTPASLTAVDVGLTLTVRE